MDPLLDAPVVVLLAFTLAAALIVVETALPTMGAAGGLAILFSVVGVIGVDHQQAEWWPLAGCAVAVVLWIALIAYRRRSLVLEVAATGLFAAGAVGFGVAQESVGTGVVGAATAAGLLTAFPPVHAAASRLADQPAQTGMDALVGRAGVVTAWDGPTGRVRVQGSLWNAAVAADGPSFAAGDEIDVVGFSGMTVQVAPHAHPVR